MAASIAANAPLGIQVTKEAGRTYTAAGEAAAIAAIPPLRQMWVGTHVAKPEPTFVHRGGDPMKPAQAVTASSLGVLDQVTKPFALPADAPDDVRRTALAEWITRDNPLPPRVLANRIWQGHFGTGLVETPSDFGLMGAPPSHPELLDYLADEFVKGGWRLKSLHRLILLSAAYRQSSVNDASLRADPENRFYARFKLRRLDAETLRDSMLAMTGSLVQTSYGPPSGIGRDPQGRVITGIDKQRVGQVAAEIREFRGPEPYKGKGVKYAGEYIFRKEGKKK